MIWMKIVYGQVKYLVYFMQPWINYRQLFKNGLYFQIFMEC